MDRPFVYKIAVSLTLIVGALAAIAFSVGVQNGLAGLAFYVSGGLLAASVLSFVFLLNDAKARSLSLPRVKMVPIGEPIDLAASGVVRVTSEANLRSLARKRNREILFCPCGDAVRLYVVSDGFTYVFDRQPAAGESAEAAGASGSD
jgi:hypothetical protein